MVVSYSSSLRWRVVYLLVHGVERERYSKTSERGVEKCTEIPPRLITQPGREKQDTWTVGEKRIA